MSELSRVLEPEVMDSDEEAHDYDAMDHSDVNERFVAEFLEFHGPCRGGLIIDVGTGPARIPILLCQRDPKARLLGIDLASSMLTLAARNVQGSGLADRIRLAKIDAKALPWPDGVFEAVLSNTIIHHIPQPSGVFEQLARVVAPGGSLFVRDLARPATRHDLDALVEAHAGHEAPAARVLFAASLHAALTIEEVRAIVRELGLPAESVASTSDRHWTWTWRRPLGVSQG